MVSIKPNLKKYKEQSIKLKPKKKISNGNAKKVTKILKTVNVEKLIKDTKKIVNEKKGTKVSKNVKVEKKEDDTKELLNVKKGVQDSKKLKADNLHKVSKKLVNAKKGAKVLEKIKVDNLHKVSKELVNAKKGNNISVNIKTDKPHKDTNKILNAKKSTNLSNNVKEEKLNIDTKEIVNVKKTKHVMPSKAVKEDLVNLCLDALQKLTVHHSKKNTIFGCETSIFAEIRCIKIPHNSGNVKFVLPHSTAASTGEICLITPDLKKGKRFDHEPTVDHWKDILREAGVTEVKTVLPLRQLKVEYDQFELKRRLLTQHDFIMVDTRVLNHASHLLGKMFFKKHNMLIPVKINEKANIKKDIDIGLRTTMLRLNEGNTSTILVGHTNMAQKNLKENILSLISQLKEKYPGGEANIRAISIKLPLSLSLPLYLTLRSVNTVGLPKLAHKKSKHFSTVEDELSTIPGSTVTVAPDGTVHLKKAKKGNRIKEDGSKIEEEEKSEVDNSEAEMSEEE